MASLNLPPSDDDLRQFLLGQLPPDEVETIGRYLESHPNALSTLPGLKTGDTLLEALRSTAGTPVHDSPELAALITRFEGMTVPQHGDALTPSGEGELTISSPDSSEPADPHSDLSGLLAPAEQIGELGRLAEYRVIRVLGRGGMGAVFEAEDTKLGRRVALKVMLPSLAANAVAKQRFVKEAKTAAKVEHDYIVPIYQIGEFRGAPFLAMPLLAGEALDERQRNHQPLPTADVLLIGRQVAEGLAAAHAAGLIHRDIKPSNIWLERHANGTFKRVRILDFGLARLTTDREALTHTGAILGTPAYMAPEQARGVAVDSRADLFSLGCVLYQMTTGQRPFKGDDTFSILTALATETPPPPVSVNTSVPSPLSALIVRLLSKNPAARPQTAHEVAEELDRIGQEPKTEITGEWTAEPKVEHAPPPRKQRRKLLIAAGVLFLALAAVAATNGKTIVRVVNNEGELVVEVEDPNVEVVVKGTTVEILDEGKRYLVSAGKDGEIEIREKGSVSVLVVEKFKVARGGKTKVTVTSERVAAARKTKEEPILTASQRKAVEWVISIGGKVEIAEKRGVWISDVKELHSSFQLGSVKLDGLTAIDDLALSQLSNLPELTYGLQLGDTSITDDGVAKLTTIPCLRGLVDLGIFGTKVTGTGLAQLKKFPNLRILNLMRCAKINGEALEHLKPIPLTMLSLQSCKQIGDSDLDTIKVKTTLQMLSIFDTAVTDDGMRKLVGLTNLEEFGVGSAIISDASIETIVKFKNLRNLQIVGPKVTSSGIARLRELPKLTSLSIGTGDQLSNASLEQLSKMNGLTLLNIIDLDSMKTVVTSADLEKLSAAIPNCKIVYDGRTIRPTAPLPPRIKTSGGMEFTLIPKGKSWLGSLGKFRHYTEEFVLPYDFYLGVYEVTQEQWEALMGKNPSHFSHLGEGSDVVVKIDAEELKKFPVENISWDDVQRFLKALNEKEKESGWVYRLPTEKEWEYACRGGPAAKPEDVRFDFFFNEPTNDFTGSEANILIPDAKRPNRTCKVGSYPPNKLGLYDMHGNVYEMCDDLVPDDKIPNRALRGGGWFYGSGYARVSNPIKTAQTSAHPAHGFRVARVPAIPRYKNPDGMEFILVPKGKSWLGGGGGFPGAKEVIMPNDFYMGVYTVTQEEWQNVMGTDHVFFFARNGERKDAVKDVKDEDLKRFPAERMSYALVEAFLDKLNTRDKQDGWMYRLPTGEEWEYACRGGPLADKSESAFHFYLDKPSDGLPPDQANYGHEGGWKRTVKVGQFKPNRLGLYDMHSNVLEWCSDSKVDDMGQFVRLVKGGSWNDPAGTASSERWFLPIVQYGSIGIRVVRVPIDSSPFNQEQRKALEWVHAKRGRLSFFGDNRWYQITPDDKLPVRPCRLANVDLNEIPLKLAELDELKELPGSVEHLRLMRTGLTDAGLAKLAAFASLNGVNSLWLDGAPITNDGIMTVAKFKNLTSLSLIKTQVTRIGVEKLAAALPRCRIEWDGPTIEPKKK